jgi:hypothetical protein
VDVGESVLGGWEPSRILIVGVAVGELRPHRAIAADDPDVAGIAIRPATVRMNTTHSLSRRPGWCGDEVRSRSRTPNAPNTPRAKR